MPNCHYTVMPCQCILIKATNQFYFIIYYLSWQQSTVDSNDFDIFNMILKFLLLSNYFVLFCFSLCLCFCFLFVCVGVCVYVSLGWGVWRWVCFFFSFLFCFAFCYLFCFFKCFCLLVFVLIFTWDVCVCRGVYMCGVCGWCGGVLFCFVFWLSYFYCIVLMKWKHP